MKQWTNFTKGIFRENPTFVMLLGMCPTLAVTTSLSNGFGMGLSASAVLIMSNMVISLLSKLIPEKVRIPCYVVLIATFVSIVEFILNAYFTNLYEQLGIFIPLIVVNCIILGRAEAFANKNDLLSSLIDAIGMGIGLTLALSTIGLIREFLGEGKIAGFPVLNKSMLIFIMPPGAFLVLGYLIALIKKGSSS